MKYYIAGRPVYESTGHKKESQAQRVLNERIGKVATGQTVFLRLDKVTYAEAAKDLREHYTSSGDRDVTEAGYRLQHVGYNHGDSRRAHVDEVALKS